MYLLLLVVVGTGLVTLFAILSKGASTLYILFHSSLHTCCRALGSNSRRNGTFSAPLLDIFLAISPVASLLNLWWGPFSSKWVLDVPRVIFSTTCCTYPLDTTRFMVRFFSLTLSLKGYFPFAQIALGPYRFQGWTFQRHLFLSRSRSVAVFPSQ